MNFDIVFSNPPYNSSIDIKILKEMVPISTELVIVHPATWLLDNKCVDPLFNSFRDMIQGSLVSSTMFNGNIVFGIQLFVPTTITHIDHKYNNLTTLDLFGRFDVFKDIYNITLFGEWWRDTVRPFRDIIDKWIDQNGSVWQKRVKAPDDIETTNKAYCQLADIRGTPNRFTDNDTMYLNDFFTLVTKDSEKNESIRKEDIKNTYKFDTQEEVKNFLAYCKTDFARFCVAIYKINAHLDSGELLHLPYLDFTQEWYDEKLYHYFDITQDMQDHINRFLPNFYDEETK